jgi:hypothetical protein
MGATNFVSIGKGATAQEAFDLLTQQAQHYHGHGGYTGTIAEKDEFTEFPRPKGMRRATVIKIVDALGNFSYPDAIEAAYPKLPIRRMWDVYDDKWGPALCMELAKGEYLFAGFASE